MLRSDIAESFQLNVTLNIKIVLETAKEVCRTTGSAKNNRENKTSF